MDQKEKARLRAKAWRDADPERARQSVKRSHEKHGEKYRAREKVRAQAPKRRALQKGYRVKSRYGLTMVQLETRIEAQGNACAVCRTSFATSAPNVDHDHATGAVRGILCHACNTTIGKLGDSFFPVRDRVFAILDYLAGRRS